MAPQAQLERPDPASDRICLDLSAEEIQGVLEPFIEREWRPDDPYWLGVVRAERELRARKRARAERRGFVRTRGAVEWSYNRRWQRLDTERRLSRAGKKAWCRWGSRCMRVTKAGVQRVHLLALMRTIDLLRPDSVLEVGFGDGVNLLTLAARFPGIRFAGAELTQGGMARARRLCAGDGLPAPLREFSPEPLGDLAAHRRVELNLADARDLPFDDGSVDLVYSRLALEQMERIRAQALSELSRVAAGGHVAMVEPFREWNEDPGSRDYIVAQEYFQAGLADLPESGLEPILTFADMPHQLFYRPVLVVARAV